MLTHVHIKNFRSFVDAEAALSPLTLVLGANGSGKSNFLKFFEMITAERDLMWVKHLKREDKEIYGEVTHALEGPILRIGYHLGHFHQQRPSGMLKPLSIYKPDPDVIAAAEKPTLNPTVKGNGAGTCQVLDSLKTGDREDLFDKIEEAFQTYVPEVEKLSLKTVGDAKQIQVRERGLPGPLPATELSEGTRLILCLLTILHQESWPRVILLEDIDRGLHPRLFEYMAPLMRRIAVDHDINIIATTHNPYLVNYFRDHKEAVVLVEKQEGESKLIPLKERIRELNDGNQDVDEVPLGELWFSGLVGGTPRAIDARPRRA